MTLFMIFTDFMEKLEQNAFLVVLMEEFYDGILGNCQKQLMNYFLKMENLTKKLNKKKFEEELV